MSRVPGRCPDKARVVEALAASVGRDLEVALRMVGDAREEATGSESRAENQYDTRATEASYLAAGQGRRVVGLRALADWLSQLDADAAFPVIAVGALVGLQRAAGGTEWLLVGPEGGHTVTVDGAEIRLVSTRSPAGAVLDGLEADDEAEIDTPAGASTVTVVAVR